MVSQISTISVFSCILLVWKNFTLALFANLHWHSSSLIFSGTMCIPGTPLNIVSIDCELSLILGMYWGEKGSNLLSLLLSPAGLMIHNLIPRFMFQLWNVFGHCIVYCLYFCQICTGNNDNSPKTWPNSIRQQKFAWFSQR